MIKITEMGMPDWRISKIISEYRSLLKMTNALARETQPLFDLTAFIEDLLPAFAAMQQDGEISDGYEKLTELVLSDMDDKKVEEVLLLKVAFQADGEPLSVS